MATDKKSMEKYKEIYEELLLRKQEIIDKAGELEAKEQPESENVVFDAVDEANTTTSSNFLKRIEEREIKLLKKIEESIIAIEQGTYGKCESCGKDINIERLKARPVASKCIECKTKQEKEEKRKKARQF